MMLSKLLNLFIPVLSSFVDKVSLNSMIRSTDESWQKTFDSGIFTQVKTPFSSEIRKLEI